MNFKEELKKILSQFMTLKESILQKIKDINTSNKYSDDYKRELINKAKAEVKAQQEQLCNQAIGIIAMAKNEILKGKGSANKDQAFDIKLNNTLMILKTVGADMTVEELQELINPFKDDYQTMKILRKVFIQGNIKGVNEIFGIDVIEHNVSLLDELQRKIASVFTGDIEQANTMRLFIAIDLLEKR